MCPLVAQTKRPQILATAAVVGPCERLGERFRHMQGKWHLKGITSQGWWLYRCCAGWDGSQGLSHRRTYRDHRRCVHSSAVPARRARALVGVWRRRNTALLGALDLPEPVA